MPEITFSTEGKMRGEKNLINPPQKNYPQMQLITMILFHLLSSTHNFLATMSTEQHFVRAHSLSRTSP